MIDIKVRKEDHLELCATRDVAFKQNHTLLDEVFLVHEAIPELSWDQVDLSCTVLGKSLSAPLIIAAMTGGTKRGHHINLDLASIAEDLGIGFALGSQRPMLENRELTETYKVRQKAPTTLVVGNLGLWQACKTESAQLEDLAYQIGADAIAIHLNPAQELAQPGGDRDFRGGFEALSRLQKDLTIPLVVKETGCGMGLNTLRRLKNIGIEHIDVAGAGGTSWTAVEMYRAEKEQKEQNILGQTLREWGIPTAAALLYASKYTFPTMIASGGIVTGLDAVRALALGASAVGIARPILKAYWKEGRDGARQYLSNIIDSIRAIMILTGSVTLGELRGVPRIIGQDLSRWASVLDY